MFKDFFSIKGVFTLRNTIIMGMLAAASVVLGQFSIYITPTFKAISFSYLPGAVVAMLFGPCAAIVFGFVTDTLKFIVRPMGPYFMGYALSEMLTFFIFACFFYKQPIRVWKVATARFLFLLTVVFGLNFIWNSMMTGMTAGKYFTGVRMINNLVQFPFHVALTTLLLKFLEKHKELLHNMNS